MVRFVPHGLAVSSAVMQDAVAWGTCYIDNTSLMLHDVQQSFKLWKEALNIKVDPSLAQIQQIVSAAQAMQIEVRLAGWVGVDLFANSAPDMIWINPILVAAAEELKSPELKDLIRVKFLHEFWHQLTPEFGRLCEALDPAIQAGLFFFAFFLSFLVFTGLGTRHP